LLLGLFGQGEEGLGVGDGRVDAVLGHVVFRQHREAVALERRAQLLGEAGKSLL
jgi:hypothetical protein